MDVYILNNVIPSYGMEMMSMYKMSVDIIILFIYILNGFLNITMRQFVH